VGPECKNFVQYTIRTEGYKDHSKRTDSREPNLLRMRKVMLEMNEFDPVEFLIKYFSE